MCQRRYTLDILQELGLSERKQTISLMKQNHRLGLIGEPDVTNPESYQRLIGKLIYLNINI